MRDLWLSPVHAVLILRGCVLVVEAERFDCWREGRAAPKQPRVAADLAGSISRVELLILFCQVLEDSPALENLDRPAVWSGWIHNRRNLGIWRDLWNVVE